MLIARFQTTIPAGLFLSWTLSVHSRYPCRLQCPVNIHSALSTPMANSWFYDILASLLFGGVEGVFHSCFSDTFSISSQLQKCSFYYSCISFTVWVLANIFVVNRRSKCFFPFLLYFKILKDLDNHTLEKSWLSQHHILNGMQNWAQIYWRE